MFVYPLITHLAGLVVESWLNSLCKSRKGALGDLEICDSDVSDKCGAENRSVSQRVILYKGNHKTVMLQMQKNPLHLFFSFHVFHFISFQIHYVVHYICCL